MSGHILNAIGLRHGTDKSSANHDYLRHYEMHVGGQAHPVKTLLEIGVYDGASLRTWQEFLPDAHIVGFDIDERCREMSGPNVTVEIGDQSNVINLVEMAVKHGPFDVIVDDGSHIWSHQILSFETLFPFVRPRGLYVLEDIDTSYGSYTEQFGRESTVTAAQYIIKIASYLLASTVGHVELELDLRLRSFVPLIDTITFIRRSALIRRK